MSRCPAAARTAAATLPEWEPPRMTFGAPIATTIEDGGTFYAAETYHQTYAARNPHQPYVAAVAAPKVDKLVKYFADRLKP